MRALMAKKGFKRFDLGVPCTLLPVRKDDYIASGPGNGLGEPAQEDGTDSF
jgi:hypothetical protein